MLICQGALSCNRLIEAAKRERDQLAATMSATQVAKAQRLSSVWFVALTEHRPLEDPPPEMPVGEMCGSDVAFVESLYWVLLEHAPDPSGLDYHKKGLASGKSRPDTIKAFLESPGYKARNRRQNEFINDVYRALLMREAEPMAYTIWGDFLGKLGKKKSPSELVIEIAKSDEYLALRRGCP